MLKIVFGIILDSFTELKVSTIPSHASLTPFSTVEIIVK